MNLFGGNYDKVGAGVSKNEPEKKRFFLFLDLLGRKFSKLIYLNFIYVITLIPLFLGLIMSLKINPLIYADGVLNVANIGKYPIISFTYDIIGFMLILISVFITSPATCGFTYVLRNMQREEHTWVFSDFREHFAKNYKQAIVLGAIDLFVSLILYFAYSFYAYAMPLMMPENLFIATIGKYAVVAIAFIFVTMHYYIYVMTVTFDLKIRQILKNALIFSIAKLPLNIFITAVAGLFLILSLWHTIIGIVCALVITVSFLGFVVVFSVYPTIEKYLILAQPRLFTDDDDLRDFED